jgi:hypothetical protein
MFDVISLPIPNAVHRPVSNAISGTGNALTLPTLNRVFYARQPNGTGADEGKYVFSAEVVALLGSWWATPRTMTEILAWSGINQYHVFASTNKGMAVYNPAVITQSQRDKAKAYFGVQSYKYLMFGGEQIMFSNEPVRFW